MKHQHLHNKLGNAIGEAKKRMFQRLNTGQDLELAVDQFILELKLALGRLVEREPENLNSEIM